MKNPKCLYCDQEMDAKSHTFNMWDTKFYFECLCGARTPMESIPEAAYAAAMRRDRAKGEWIDKGESPFCGSEGRMYFNHEYECNHCGFTVRGGEPKFCPNCGADMRKEANDER